MDSSSSSSSSGPGRSSGFLARISSRLASAGSSSGSRSMPAPRPRPPRRPPRRNSSSSSDVFVTWCRPCHWIAGIVRAIAGPGLRIEPGLYTEYRLSKHRTEALPQSPWVTRTPTRFVRSWRPAWRGRERTQETFGAAYRRGGPRSLLGLLGPSALGRPRAASALTVALAVTKCQRSASGSSGKSDARPTVADASTSTARLDARPIGSPRVLPAVSEAGRMLAADGRPLRADPWSPDYGMGYRGVAEDASLPRSDPFVETTDWTSPIPRPERPRPEPVVRRRRPPDRAAAAGRRGTAAGPGSLRVLRGGGGSLRRRRPCSTTTALCRVRGPGREAWCPRVPAWHADPACPRPSSRATDPGSIPTAR